MFTKVANGARGGRARRAGPRGRSGVELCHLPWHTAFPGTQPRQGPEVEMATEFGDDLGHWPPGEFVYSAAYAIVLISGSGMFN